MASAASRARERAGAGWGLRGQLLRVSLVLPGALMAVSLLALLLWCRALLGAAAEGRPAVVGGFDFWLAVGGFFTACGAVVVVQSMRLASRVAGPELRLRRALQRIREHDIGFRVTLRRGDLLTELARDCNELLDWLNANPPAGVRTGSDVVAIDVAEEGP
jgi:hypothetical protein